MARPTIAAEESDPDERLARLFDEHHQRLYRLARRLTGSAEEARDLVQETYLRAAGHLASVPRQADRGEAWLVRTVINLCRDRGRRLAVRRRMRPQIEASRPDPGPGPDAAAVARLTVQAALGRLSPRRRAVVVLRELEDRTVAEIAALLGLTRVTVRWHLAAARRQLARVLSPPMPSIDHPEGDSK